MLITGSQIRRLGVALVFLLIGCSPEAVSLLGKGGTIISPVTTNATTPSSPSSTPNSNTSSGQVVPINGTAQIVATGANRKPIIQQVIANPNEVLNKDDIVTFKVLAFDPDGDALSLSWQTTKGSLSADTGESVTWKPLKSDGTVEIGVASITVLANDNRNGIADSTQNIIIAANGTATLQQNSIKVPDSEKSSDKNTPVGPTVTKVEVSANEMTLDVGQSQQLGASVLLNDNSRDQNILWLSSNPNIVKVTPTGQLTRHATGDVVIFAKSLLDPNQSQTIRVSETGKPVTSDLSQNLGLPPKDGSDKGVTTPILPPPVVPVPTEITITNVTPTGFSVTWTAVSGATAYSLFLNGVPSGSAPTNSYTFSGLPPNLPYAIQISAVGSNGESPRSDVRMVTTGVPVASILPAPFGLMSTNVNSSGFTVTWLPVTGATSYNVYRNGSFVNTTSSPNYTFGNLAASQPYAIQVSALNSAGESLRSEVLSVTTTAPLVSIPTAPTGLFSFNLTSAGFAVNWNSVNGAHSYKVYQNGSLVTTVSLSSYSFTGLTAGSSYGIQVSAVNSAGESTRSDVLNVSTVANTLSAPTLLATSTSGNSIILGWNTVIGASGYKVYRDNVLLATITGGTDYPLSGLNAGTTYTFQVSATNSTSESPKSSPLTVTTTAAAPPLAALTINSGETKTVSLNANRQSLNFSGTSGQTVTIRQNKVSNGDAFLRLYNPSGVLVASDDDNGGNGNSLISNFTLTSSGTWKIEAGTFNDNASYAGNYTVALEGGAVAPTVTVPAAPTGLVSSNVTNNSATISWNSVNGATGGYRVFKNGALVATSWGETSYNLIGLSSNVTYNIQISATNDGGESVKSSVLNITTSAPAVSIPSAPTGLASSNVTSTGFTFSWGTVSGATSYKVYQNGTLIAENVTGSSVTYGGRASGTTYQLQVSAVNSAGESTKSSVLNITTESNQPNQSNYALGKNAFASSTYTSQSAAGNVTNGGLHDMWSSGNYLTGDDWIYLDLSQTRSISKVKVLPGGSPPATYYWNVETSLDAVNWTVKGSGSAYNETWGTTDFSLTSARYVRVRPTNWGSSWIAILEIEVY